MEQFSGQALPDLSHSYREVPAAARRGATREISTYPNWVTQDAPTAARFATKDRPEARGHCRARAVELVAATERI